MLALQSMCWPSRINHKGTRKFNTLQMYTLPYFFPLQSHTFCSRRFWVPNLLHSEGNGHGRSLRNSEDVPGTGQWTAVPQFSQQHWLKHSLAWMTAVSESLYCQQGGSGQSPRAPGHYSWPHNVASWRTQPLWAELCFLLCKMVEAITALW